MFSIIKKSTLVGLELEKARQKKVIETLSNNIIELIGKIVKQDESIASRGRRIISLENKETELQETIAKQKAQITELQYNKRDNHGCLLRNKIPQTLKNK